MNPQSGLFCCLSQGRNFHLHPYPIAYALSKVQLSESRLLWASSHLTESVCWVSVPSAPTGSATYSPPPKVSLPALKASSDTHRSVSLDHNAVRKSCEMPPWEQHLFAWEMHWSSVACSWSLPELCHKSALPGHVPCWTWPNSLAWIPGMTLNFPHFYGLVWSSLHTWLTLVTVTRPALGQVLWDWAFVGEGTAPAHLAASLASSLSTLAPQQTAALCIEASRDVSSCSPWRATSKSFNVFNQMQAKKRSQGMESFQPDVRIWAFVSKLLCDIFHYSDLY